MQVQSGDKVLKVKLNDSTITVLSKVFSLQAETIYLIGDDSVVMPDPDTMVFNVADILSFVIYEVHGEQITRKPDAIDKLPVPLGNRFSYQSSYLAAGTSSERREGSCSKKHSLPSRPTFTFKSSREHGQTQKWRKNIIFSEVVDGKPSPIYQIYLTLSNETASVEQVTRMVEDEVGTRVMLLDNKGLRIMASESTKGKSMLDMIFSIFLL